MTRWLAAALTLLVLGLVPSAASAQDDVVQILSVDTEAAPEVEMIIAIPPSLGEVPANSDFFAITEDGQRRQLVVESLRDSVEIVLVIDTSGSMRGAAIAAAKSAATDFVRNLPAGARISVVGFGETVSIASEMSTDKASHESAIAALTPTGETALWEGLEVAAGILEESNADQPYVLVLSDGGNTVEGSTQVTASEALLRAGAPLYAVVLQTDESNESELVQTVDRVGGAFLATGDTSELSALYAEIGGRLTSRYAIRFEAGGSGETTATLTVATDTGVAIARTVLQLGGDGAATETDAAAPAALSTAAVPAELGTVIAPDAAPLNQPWVLWVGAGAFFIALFAIASTFSFPKVRVRDLGAQTKEAGSKIGGLKETLSRSASGVVAGRDKEGNFDLSLDAAGMNIRAGEFLVVTGSVIVGSALVGSILAGAIGSFIFSGIAAVGSLLLVRLRAQRRRSRFSDQLGDTLTVMAGALRSGRGLPQALELVAQEGQSPTSDEFRRVVIEARIGRDQVESLEAMARRMDNEDLDWIAQAIAINRELGGDLVEVLENVSETIRSRTRVHRQVRALSAEGRISGWLMVAMPFVMFFYMKAVNPEYLDPLITTTTGLLAIAGGLVLIGFGTIWIRKLVDLKY